ncbi:J domain-containing protein [Cohnella nanjingensis]|uniref:J domain-containing protein n=1 Tax=Cohnella nanjingensis TaxID=1387779 RepID=A0A7X0RYF3_9BACL|nr:J domain-containing protein [Cohnella nanjingensis]MBB6674761.1 J domain-containing protein [Cohnella nanjingensis]
MDELKQAYDVLGLSENADKEELENRYYILVRRARAQKMREGDAEDGALRVDEEAISRAYRYIKDYEETQAKAAFTEQNYGKYKKMAGRAQKWDHFLHYYKFHILGGILLLIAIGYGIKSYVDHKHEQAELAKLPPANLSVMFYGNYFYGDGMAADTKPLGEDILKQFPDWQRVIADLTYVPSDTKSEQDMALIQKSMLVLMTDKSDLYIMDKLNFAKLAPQGALKPLDGESGIPADLQMKSKTEEDTSEHVYGVDLSGTTMAKELGVNGTEFIAGIRANAKHPEEALTYIKHFEAKK